MNNAGIYDFAPLEAITPEHIHRQLNLNVVGLLLTTQEAVKLIGPEGGSIVNIGSIVGPMPAPQASTYSASKAAVDAITVSLSQELGPRKIRVNSLNPGMVETEGLRASGLNEGDFRKQQDRETPLGRIAQPDDIALAATFLAGDDAVARRGGRYTRSAGAGFAGRRADPAHRHIRPRRRNDRFIGNSGPNHWSLVRIRRERSEYIALPGFLHEVRRSTPETVNRAPWRRSSPAYGHVRRADGFFRS